MSPVTIKPNVIYLASVDIVKQFSTIRQVDHLNTLKSYTYPTEKTALICTKRNLRLSMKENFSNCDRIWTCNPQIQSLVPYPLGHMFSLDEQVRFEWQL